MWLILFIGMSWHRNGQRQLNTPWNPAVDQVCTVEQDRWSSCLTWWQQGMTYLSIMVSPSTSSPLSPNTAAIVVEHCTCEKMPPHKSSLQTCSQSEPCWPAMSDACLAHAVFKTPCCLGLEGGSHPAGTCGCSTCFHDLSCSVALISWCRLIWLTLFGILAKFCFYSGDVTFCYLSAIWDN